MKLKAGRKPQFTVIGGAYTEIVLRTPSALNYEGTTISDSTDILPGGRAACIAAALARLQCRVFLVSCLGTDPFAGLLLNGLQKQNVNLDYVQRHRDEPTGLIHNVITRKGPAQRIYSPGAAMKLTSDHVHKASAMMSASDIVIITPDVPREAFTYAVRLAHHLKAPVMIDPDPCDDFNENDISGCDIIVPDAAAAAALCGWEMKTMNDVTRGAARLLARGAGAAAIYLGARGVVAATSPRDPSYIPLPAGRAPQHPYARSAFDAGLAWALTLGYNLPEAVWVGFSAAVATRADIKNPFESFPVLEELIESQAVEMV